MNCHARTEGTSDDSNGFRVWASASRLYVMVPPSFTVVEAGPLPHAASSMPATASPLAPKLRRRLTNHRLIDTSPPRSWLMSCAQPQQFLLSSSRPAVPRSGFGARVRRQQVALPERQLTKPITGHPHCQDA